MPFTSSKNSIFQPQIFSPTYAPPGKRASIPFVGGARITTFEAGVTQFHQFTFFVQPKKPSRMGDPVDFERRASQDGGVYKLGGYEFSSFFLSQKADCALPATITKARNVHGGAIQFCFKSSLISLIFVSSKNETFSPLYFFPIFDAACSPIETITCSNFPPFCILLFLAFHFDLQFSVTCVTSSWTRVRVTGDDGNGDTIENSLFIVFFCV